MTWSNQLTQRNTLNLRSMDTKINSYIEDLRHAVTIASLSHEVWWVCMEGESQKKYAKLINRYSLFFQTSTHAHFVALVITLHRLYENNPKTVNVPHLVKLIKQCRPFSLEAEKLISDLLFTTEPYVNKIAILRNNVFGHSSARLTSREAFARAGLSPNQVKQLLDTSKSLLNEITHHWNGSFHAFNLGAGAAVVNLLDDLNGIENNVSNKADNKR